MIKSIYQSLVPLKIRLQFNRLIHMPIIVLAFSLYDMNRFRRHFAGSTRTVQAHRLARITALYHVLEKGLSFRDSRPLFGKDRVRSLVEEMQSYLDAGGASSAIPWQSALSVLNAYVDHHIDGCGISVEDPFLVYLREAIDCLSRQTNLVDVGGGTLELSRLDVQKRAKGDFATMALSRYSVRHFGDEPVSRDIIEQAVVWAQKSPSVCNRQASRVHVLKDRQLINQALEIHGGTRGFTEQIHTLLVVTGDLRILLSPPERNQIYLDTGIFSMSLLYGLHFQGVGTCPLHWCVDRKKDASMRALVGIPDEETITVLIGVGALPERFKVAHSQRKPLEEVLVWNS